MDRAVRSTSLKILAHLQLFVATDFAARESLAQNRISLRFVLVGLRFALAGTSVARQLDLPGDQDDHDDQQ